MKSTTSAPSYYLLPDPQHEYGLALEQAMRRLAPHAQPIYLFESSQEAAWRQPFYPHVRFHREQIAFYKDKMLLPEIADKLRELGVNIILPYFEQSMLDAAYLQESLQLPWNSQAILRMFRNKAQLKQFIQKNNPSIPLGFFHAITNVQDFLHLEVPPAFVIKPVDGFGNRHIAFFQRSSRLEDITTHLRNMGGHGAIVEETFEGVEFCVNGQMDEQGRPIIVSVLRYERTLANGKPNVSHLTFHMPPSDARFEPLTSYANSIMITTGLKRCPFHMELMLTEQGPRLIEIAARLPGTGLVFLSNSIHQNGFNWFEMAAHYYSKDQPYAGIMPNWQQADKISALHLDGISTVHQPIYQIEGVGPIERHPTFQRWVRKPRVGQVLKQTLDLYSVPFSFQLLDSKNDEALAATAIALEQEMVFNQGVPNYQKWLVRAEQVVTFLRNRLRWLQLKQHLQRQHTHPHQPAQSL